MQLLIVFHLLQRCGNILEHCRGAVCGELFHEVLLGEILRQEPLVVHLLPACLPLFHVGLKQRGAACLEQRRTFCIALASSFHCRQQPLVGCFVRVILQESLVNHRHNNHRLAQCVGPFEPCVGLCALHWQHVVRRYEVGVCLAILLQQLFQALGIVEGILLHCDVEQRVVGRMACNLEHCVECQCLFCPLLHCRTCHGAAFRQSLANLVAVD